MSIENAITNSFEVSYRVKKLLQEAIYAIASDSGRNFENSDEENLMNDIILEKLNDLVFDIDSFISQQKKYNDGEEC